MSLIFSHCGHVGQVEKCIEAPNDHIQVHKCAPFEMLYVVTLNSTRINSRKYQDLSCQATQKFQASSSEDIQQFVHQNATNFANMPPACHVSIHWTLYIHVAAKKLTLLLIFCLQCLVLVHTVFILFFCTCLLVYT